MRFLEDGPSIPDELLLARDQGRVVFFCGSGVSRAKAGFDDFFGLASSVISDLGVETGSPTLKLIDAAKEITSSTGVEGVVSADRVFGLLEREFLSKDIYKSVSKALTPDSQVDLSAHQTMLKLATTKDGLVRLVTTNFDRLFDLCNSDIHSFIPPKLPDLNHSNEFNGTVYLHGKVTEDGTGAASNGFVLSSSEFGDAYLADGWATSFVKEILQKYVVVFVGYSADDPPIQYLLEALNKNSSSLNDIYAFQSGDESYANSKWQNKGVKAIAYEDKNGHIALWNTLDAWADRASDPHVWYQRIITKAVLGPHNLKPFERGQVAHIVSTMEGAKKFANCEVLPPSTWLYVFDPNLRYETPRNSQPNKKSLGDIVDPFYNYSLDSDHTPQYVDPNNFYNKREVPIDAWDAFDFNSFDIKSIEKGRSVRFRGDNANFPQFSTLPERLNYLAFWLSRVAEQREVIWWVVKQDCLHPWVEVVLKSNLEQRANDINTTINKAWEYIFDSFENHHNKRDHDWFALESSIKNSGWSFRKLRHFAKITKPYIKVYPPYLTQKKSSSEPINLNDLIHLDVHYYRLPKEIEIPDEWMIRFVEILRRNLELAAELENEIGGYNLDLRYPLTSMVDIEDAYTQTDELTAWVLLFIAHIEKLAKNNVDAVQKEFSKWPYKDNAIFARLRIWALGKTYLVPNESINATLNQLSDDEFWDSYNTRDLLLTLKARWKELDQCCRSKIENRILQGPKPWKTEDEEGFKERNARRILNRVTWLKKNDCEVTKVADKLIVKLRRDTPEWKPEHAEDAARSFEFRGGLVTKNTEHSLLADEPLASIIERASEISGRQANFLIDKDPFLGLLQEKPIRAFRALTCSARKGNVVDWAWNTFLYAENRKDDSPKFVALIAEHLFRFANEDIAKVIHAISSWFENSTIVLTDNYQHIFIKLASKLINVMLVNPEQSESSIKRGSKSPDWSMESINSPTGKLTKSLFQSLKNRTFEPGEGFPKNLLSLFNQLLVLPDNLHRYAIVIFCRKLSFSFWVDPVWTQKNLLSLLKSPLGDDRQAFWAGVLWGGIQGKELFIILKPDLFNLIRRGKAESREHQNAIVGLIYSAWKIKDEDKRLISDFEFKELLVKANDDFRCGILWKVMQDLNEDYWLQTFKELMLDVWPKQLVAKSFAVSERFCQIALWSDDHFPEVLKLIVPFLTKLERANQIYSPDNNIKEKYPKEFLVFLLIILPEDTNKWPYYLGDDLSKIKEHQPELSENRHFIELKRKWDAK